MNYTKEQFAGLIDGREYPFDLTREEQEAARDSGLVVVFGASDDLCEIRGTIYDETGCYEGGIILLNKRGVVESPDDEEIEVLEKFRVLDAAKKETREIKAIWDEDGISWQYRTDIPHATFKIMEDGECYCVGIVFEASQLT